VHGGEEHCSLTLVACVIKSKETVHAYTSILIVVGDSFSHTLGQLCYAAFETMFCLLGAAVMVFVYTKNDPDRKTLAGVLAAALYVMAPFVLFVIGLMDQTFHFRNPQAHKPDKT